MLRTSLLVALLASPAIAETSPLANGFYIGGTFGVADGSTIDTNNPAAERKYLDDKRFGLQLGYNKSLGGNLFWGVEGDLKIGELSSRWEDRKTNQYSAYYTEDTLEQTIALKGKLGYLIDDRLSVYGTAGAVWAQTSNSLGCDRALVAQTNGCGEKFEDKKESSSTGYALGIGTEYLVKDGLSFKMEYTHIDLGKHTVRLEDPNYAGSPVNDRKFKTHFGEVSFGVNYRF